MIILFQKILYNILYNKYLKGYYYYLVSQKNIFIKYTYAFIILLKKLFNNVK